MGTQLQERQTPRTTQDRKVAPSKGQPRWPFLVAGLALVTLAVATVTFVIANPAPLRIEVGVIEDMHTGSREGGAFAVPGAGPYEGFQPWDPQKLEAIGQRQRAEAFRLGSGSGAVDGAIDPMTAEREGGAYAAADGLPVPDLDTGVREGGDYAAP
jgi:hypothetical protein